jgi:parvulin-like peptidyl-prolyl isomerase
MTRRHYLVVAIVFVIAAAAVPTWRGMERVRAVRMPGPPAVAFVNGRAIGQEDLDLRLSQILPMASFHGRVEPARLLGLRRAALDELILDELIFQRASDRGVGADASEIEQNLEQARAQFASGDEFRQALAEIGLTERAFRQRVERLAIIRVERAAHVGHEPTESEITAYYEANRSKFERPEQVHLLEILVSVDPADPSSAAAAERKAQTVARRLRKGEPFGPLAREMSDDDYRVKDGDFGFVHRGRLAAELDAAVFGARTGQITVTRTMFGFHVFVVTARVAPTRLTPAEARPHIVDRLRRQYREEDMRAFRRDLLAGARIEIADKALEAATPAEIPELKAPAPARSLPDDQARVRRTDEVG